MHTYTLASFACRALPAAAVAVLAMACSDQEPTTAPALPAGAQAAAAPGLLNGGRSPKAAAFGQIVFSSVRDGKPDLYIAGDSANAPASRLTNNAASELMAAWAPDYKKIAFVSDKDGNLEIYSMKTTGGAVTRLTTHATPDADPVYSPDGSKIAFASYRDGNAEIYVMDADGKNVKRLTVNAATDREPTWSPDGSKIAFSSTRGPSGATQIYMMNAADGSGVVPFSPATTVERSPHWSPDGARIVFLNGSGGTDIVWREVASRASHTIISTPFALGAPNWSRDGLNVVFDTMTQTGQNYVVMDAFKAGGVLFQGVVNGYANVGPVWSR